MSIREWLNRLRQFRAKEDDGLGDHFIDPEPPVISHSDPKIKTMLSELSATKRKINWTSWKIFQLEHRRELSEFERFQLKRLPQEFEKLVKLYRAQEALLREFQKQDRKRGRISFK